MQEKTNLLKRPAWIAVILVVVYILTISGLPHWWEPAVEHLGIEDKNLSRWEAIKSLSYFFGVLLLILQISISNRRADASEKTAEATLEANTEQRYHNSISHLVKDAPVIRIGAIYNLYHISQSTNTYKKTIFDIFCESLKRSKNEINPKEKQIIIDKLFRERVDSRVMKDPESIDLKKANLKEADLTKADLARANLTGANLTGANLTGANLTGANLTEVDLTEVDLTEVDLTEVDLSAVTISSTDRWRGLNLTKANLTNSKFIHCDMSNICLSSANLEQADLTGSNLTGANLTGANLTDYKELTIDQLSNAKSLYNVVGLDKEIEAKLKQKKPRLFLKKSNNK